MGTSESEDSGLISGIPLTSPFSLSPPVSSVAAAEHLDSQVEQNPVLSSELRLTLRDVCG